MQNFCIPKDRKPNLERFKMYMQEHGVECSLPDQLIYRYLYTSKFCEENTLNRIKKLLTWRSDNNIDNILNDPVIKKNHDTISRRLLYRTHKVDRWGRPCTIFNVGHLDLRHIMKHYTAQEILTAHIYYNEYMEKLCREASEKMGVDYIGNATIIDLKGLSLSRHMNLGAMSIFKEMILIHTYYYPESSDVVYIVNFPPLFNYFWNIIKPWMTDLQKQKLKRISTFSKLLSYFLPENLPKIYGGLCECEGGCVLGRAAVDEPAALTDIISLSNHGSENVDVYVSKGDLITWCFNSLDKDIEFQALFISVDGLMKSLVPLCRVPSKSSLIRGEWKCENDGKVRLVFDNSKSNWLSCSVSYEVNIVSGVKTAATGVDTVTNKVEPLTNEVETATTEVDTVTNEVETINKE
ncbi:hypothetical protein WA171_004253 [Blastocystis sp. BT1]